jgi:hypothetical protein
MDDKKKDSESKNFNPANADYLIPENASALRFMRGKAHGTEYKFFDNLEEACKHPDAAMVMEADSGGQILVACPVSKVHATEIVLHQLLCDLEEITWGSGGLSTDNKPYDARIYYELLPVGSGVCGGMGGGMVIDGVWVHSGFEESGLASQIKEVVAGKRVRLKI